MQEKSASQSARLVSAHHKIVSHDHERHMEIALNGMIADGYELVSYHVAGTAKGIHYSALFRKEGPEPIREMTKPDTSGIYVTESPQGPRTL